MKIAVIGIGPPARRVYVPALQRLRERFGVEVALEERLHILMDKPVTTRENAATDLHQAVGIYGDYEALLSAHGRLQ